MSEIKLNVEQTAFVKNTKGNMLVSASAGSGKTTLTVPWQLQHQEFRNRRLHHPWRRQYQPYPGYQQSICRDSGPILKSTENWRNNYVSRYSSKYSK